MCHRREYLFLDTYRSVHEIAIEDQSRMGYISQSLYGEVVCHLLRTNQEFKYIDQL
jgi:hypothetical protein